MLGEISTLFLWNPPIKISTKLIDGHVDFVVKHILLTRKNTRLVKRCRAICCVGGITSNGRYWRAFVESLLELRKFFTLNEPKSCPAWFLSTLERSVLMKRYRAATLIQ